MKSWREKTAWMIAGVLALVVAAIFSGVIEGGPLDPPAVPPAPTDGVREPGTPISSLPFTTAGPGRHYLTRNLTVTTVGIQITQSGVEVDLNGFTITAVGNTIAILIGSGTSGTYIHGGNIVGGQTAISQPPSATVTTMALADIVVSGTTSTAITVQENTTIRRCRVINAGADGIFAGPGAVIDSCVIDNPNLSGIIAGADSSVSNCTVRSAGAGGPQEAIEVGNGSIVDTCAVIDTEATGIRGGAGVTARNVSVRATIGPGSGGITLGNGANVSQCAVRSAAVNGITTANYAHIELCSIAGSFGTGMTTGARSTIRNSLVDAAVQDGLVAVSGTLFDGNVVVFGNSDGIEVSVGNRLLNNVVAHHSGGAGIHLTGTVNIVDGNVATANANGILSDTGNSTVVRNSARNNTSANYALVADDLQGVVITLANILSSTISHFNYAP